MKTILLTFLTLLIALSSHASGYVRINCQSKNSRIALGHTGFKDSVVVQGLIYGPGFPNRLHAEIKFNGNDLSIYEDGVRFLLRGVFEEYEPSYRTPTLEIRMAEYPFHVIERGSCEMH